MPRAGSGGSSRRPPPLVFGPGFGAAADVPTRTGNIIKGAVGLLSDQSHLGLDRDAKGRTVLRRDGAVVWQAATNGSIQTPVPAGAGSYTLAMSMDRAGEWSPYSPHVEAEWGFTSAHSDAATALPLQVVRFRPVLDLDNTAPAGPFAAPLRVERAPGAAAAAVASVAVEVSYDGGATWTSAPIAGSGNNRTVRVVNPAGGMVSLRAAVTESAGATVKQTIIGAYRVR